MVGAAAHEHALLERASTALAGIPGVRLLGTTPDKVSVATFVVDGVTPEELAKKLDAEGIAIRAGHHCAQPTLRAFGFESAARASLAFYNTQEEVDRLVAVVQSAAGG